MQSFIYQGNPFLIMPIRSQIFHWDAGASSTSAGQASTPLNTADEGIPVDVLSGNKGDKNTSAQTQPPNTFVVIERIAMTPTFYTCGERSAANPNPTYRGLPLQYGVAGPRAFFQPRVNDTFYFSSPDGTTSIGMPGSAIPFPSMPSQQSVLEKPKFNKKDSSTGDSGMTPLNIYVMGNQTWDIGVSFTNGGAYQGATVTGSANTSVDENTTEPSGKMGFSIPTENI